MDTGDVVIRPADVLVQTEGAIEHITAASRTSQLTLTLGGDHWKPGLSDRNRSRRSWRRSFRNASSRPSSTSSPGTTAN